MPSSASQEHLSAASGALSDSPMSPEALFCSSDTQYLALVKVSVDVMSYTTAAAAAPR